MLVVGLTEHEVQLESWPEHVVQLSVQFTVSKVLFDWNPAKEKPFRF